VKRNALILGALTLLLVLYGCQSAPSHPVTAASYSVRYYPNGATGGNVPEDSNNYVQGATVTVLGNNSGTLVNTGYAFDGWNTSPDGKGITYDARGVLGSTTFLMGAENVKLYAVWKDPIVGPWNLTSVNGQSVALAPLGFQSMTLLVSADKNTWIMTSTPVSGDAVTSTGTWIVADSPSSYSLTSGNIVTFNAVVNGTTLTVTPTTTGIAQLMVFSKQ
jgi:hypothetical protein